MTRRRALTAALVAIILIGIAAIYVFKIAGRMPDYEVYRRAAERALAAEPLYRPDDGHYQFKYLPAFAVVMLPLGFGSDAVVRACWFVLSVLVLVLLLRQSVTVLPERLHSRAYLIGITFVLLAKFYAHEIELGQVNIMMAALVVLAVAEMQAGREFSAGLLIAGAIVLKPYAVLLLPWLVGRRRVASLAGAALGTAVALLLPASVYGFDGNARLLGEWWRTVTDTTAPNLADLNNVSAAAVFARLLGVGPTAQALATALVIALLAVAAAVFLTRSRVARPEPLYRPDDGHYQFKYLPAFAVV
ncbi:MAG TPA: glycosyltransferase family 87 protein, partial [Vicinamibacterales bacterium]|nr:glycosyltransferase family 87 protein [Vicinamibacterales bacterium]